MCVYPFTRKQILRPFVMGLLLITLVFKTSAQVRLTKVDALNNRVVIKNFGGSAVNISGYWFCHGFTYHQVSDGTIVSGSTNLAAGAQVELTLSQVLTNAGSDLSFYHSPSFGAASAMVDFIQWGSGGNGRENVAVAKGIWTAGQFVNATGTAIYYGGTGSENGLSNWSTVPHPSITSIVRQTPTDATTDADQVIFRVTFDRGVQNVDVTDFSISGTAAGDGTVNNVSAVSNAVYDVTITGVTNSAGTINLDIKGNGNTSGINNIIADPNILDQNQTSNGNTINRSEFGQSFTANNSGELTSVTLEVSGASTYTGTATMELRNGDGLSGAILATEMINIAGGSGLQNFTFSTPANVTAGQQYTVRFTGPGNFSSEFVVRASQGDPLSGGVIYQPTVLASADLTVKIFVTSGGQGGLSSTAPSTDETYTIQNNLAPTATNVSITGTFKSGQQLTGSYTWTDADNGDTESGTTFKWYRSDDAAGTGKVAIAGANTVNYTLTNSDINKFISFEVTPNDGTTAGTPVESVRALVANVFITSIARQTPSDATTNADEVTFRVIFSAGVARLSKDDFVLSGTVAGDGTVSSITRVNGSTYDIKVTGIDISEGTINLDLKGADGAGTNNIIKANETQDATNNGNLVQDSGGDTFFWQSFVAEQTGLFHSVTLRKSQHSHTYEGTATLKLYAGEGTGGAELASQQIFTSQSSGDETYYFELPASITQGSIYTWFWQAGTGTGATGFSGQTGNLYGGGRGLSEQFPTATSLDWYFITQTITGTLEGLGSPAPTTDETYTIVNPPVANNVAISGTLAFGQQLTGTYTYSDPQSDAESGTTFRWLRADDTSGTNKAAIAGATATNYTVTTADAGKFLIFEVTPSDGTVTGVATESTTHFIPSLITVQSIARQTPANENVGATSNPVFRVTFSENVSNVTADDFVLNSTVGGSINSLNAVDAKTYDLTISGLNNADGTLGLKVKGIDGTAGANDISVTSFENGAVAHQQTTENDFLNQALLGQSFTAASSNFLTAFTLFAKAGNHTFSGTARLRVFQGDASNSSVLNDANAVLTEQTVNISNDTGAAGQTFNITSPPQLTSGTVYSVVLDLFNGNGDRAFFAHTTGNLAGGRAFFTGSHNGHAAFDFMIDIFEGTQIVNNLFDQAPGTNESFSTKAIDQTIAFSTTSSNGAESISSANLEVALSAAEDLDVTVDYTVTGTATGSGTDYTLANGTLTITKGSTTNNITIASIVDDALSEADERVIVTLSNPMNATLGINKVHTYTINDNDNVAPVASNVVFTGTLEVGETLTGSYTYADAESDTESGTSFKWYASDDATGTNKAAIAGATAQTFVLTSAQLGKFVSFEVTPNDGTSAGTAVESTRQGTVKTDQTITFGTLAAKTYGDATFGLTATSTSNLAVAYTSSNTAVATVSGSTVTIVGVGTTNITASQAGNASFNAAPNVIQSLAINKATLTATADDKSRTYGDANPPFTISYTGFVNGENKSVIDVEPIPGTEAAITTNVGTADITLAGGSDNNYTFSLNNGTLTITKAALIATANDKSREYGDTNPAFTISYTGFKNGESASVIDTEPAASTTAMVTTGVGTAAISLTGGSDNNYDISTLNSGTLTITKATLTATADDKSKTYGAANPALTISYTGFKNSEGASVIDTEPTVSTSANGTSNVGTYGINLSGGTDDNYSLITNNGSLTVGKVILTAMPDAESRIYGDDNPSFTISYSGFVNGEDKSVIDTEPTASTSATATTNVGTADVTLVGGSDNNYTFGLNNGTLTITKAALTATADDKSREYGDTNPAFTISYTGFKNGESASVIDTEPAASTTAMATTGVGTAVISMAGGSDNNYDISTLNSGTLTITKATLTATADDKSKIYGATNPALTISYKGFKNGEDKSVIDIEPTVSTSATASTGAGTTAIALAGGVDDNYNFSLNNGTLTVAKATLTATADNTARVYGDANPVFTISYTGFVNGEDKSVIDTEPIASTTATATTNAGKADITPFGGSDDNYDFSFNNGTLTINKAELILTAEDKSRAYGDPNPAFTISYTGFKNNETASVIDTKPTASTTATTTTEVGTADITLTGGSDDNYSMGTLNKGTLTITKAILTATADDKSKIYGAANPTLTIGYIGFKNGEDKSVIDTEPTANTAATTATGVGTFDITLAGGSDNNYDISTLNNGTLTITKAALTVTADDKSKEYGDPNPALTINYTGFVNGEDASVIDTAPTASTTATSLTNVGTTAIALTGGNDDNYELSVLNNGILTITKATLTAIADDKEKNQGTTNPALTISYTGFKNGEDESVLNTAPGISTTVDLNTTSGTFPITLSGGNDDNYIFTLVNGVFTVKPGAVVLNVAVPADDAYMIGQNLDFLITWTLPVTIEGTPSIPITIGSNLVQAQLLGTAINTNNTIFRYTIAEGDVDSDGIVVGSAIDLNGGTIKDQFGVDAVIGLNNLATTAGIIIDAIRPVPTLSTTAISVVNEPFNVTFTYSEEVTDFVLADITVVNGVTSNFTNVTANRAWSATITPIAGGNVEVSLASGVAKDAVGNGSASSNTITRQFNTIPTDITLSSASIAENNEIGDIVGTLNSTDPDVRDSHTYTLVSGTGDTDNGVFSIAGDELRANASFDFETGSSYSIRVKTEDRLGGTFEKMLSITIDNVLEPSIIVSGEISFPVSALGLSQQLPLTITNNGEISVEVRAVSTPRGFSVIPGAFVLEVGASREVSVVFVPTEVRAYSGDITFSFGEVLISHPVSGEGAIITSVDDDLIDADEISLYPNPTETELNIDLSQLNGKAVDIVMRNASGLAIYKRKSYSKNSLSLNVQSFKSGLYIMQFSNGKSVVRKKVMIKK